MVEAKEVRVVRVMQGQLFGTLREIADDHYVKIVRRRGDDENGHQVDRSSFLLHVEGVAVRVDLLSNHQLGPEHLG